jgi:hypothetical protein
MRANMLPDVIDIGSMDRVCHFCGARSWIDENINCCAKGSIVLPNDQVPPSALMQSTHRPVQLSLNLGL